MYGVGPRPAKEDLKRRAAEIIDSKADELTALAQTILKNPEPGFRELKTARLVAEKFAELGMQPRNGLAVTGVRADALGGSAGPTLAILGEMDSLIVAEHPHADPDTGAAHACGHHCQIAMMLGAATALTQSGVLQSLSGPIAFLAVPAEDNTQIDFPHGLRETGQLGFPGRQVERARRGPSCATQPWTRSGT